jgi:hypothetical protein
MMFQVRTYKSIRLENIVEEFRTDLSTKQISHHMKKKKNNMV